MWNDRFCRTWKQFGRSPCWASFKSIRHSAGESWRRFEISVAMSNCTVTTTVVRTVTRHIIQRVTEKRHEPPESGNLMLIMTICISFFILSTVLACCCSFCKDVLKKDSKLEDKETLDEETKSDYVLPWHRKTDVYVSQNCSSLRYRVNYAVLSFWSSDTTEELYAKSQLN